ncbi:LysM peptidoglycan-binding domain-containing protein [Nocardioides sp. SR21]|uniref:LysM peptidoglycan-binding domain-containing protein n=1 Tax=Nocardioides sp. SR21 TaxID=2919501 RepID=UPI001FAB3261|nr:LysM peptidoglycan-binding domain-containing protein [Nocardioides sp. SR21]
MHAPVHRCLVVWLAATAAGAALVAWLLPQALAPATRFDDVLVRLCAGAGCVAAAWLWVVTTAVVAEAVTGATAPGVPAPLRRLVLLACGAAVVAGLAVPAQATPGEVHRDRQPSVAGLPFPDRALGAPVHVRTAEQVVVRPGDTLWELAAADLGPGADPVEIDARWREIYARNRSVIGPDPDLIEPAQRLRLPAHHDQ